MARTYRRRFTFEFAHPVETVWPALADTARFNEAAGFPKHRIEEVEQEDGSVRLFAEGTVSGTELAWEEFPVEWVYGRWFWHWREFSKGPFATIGAMVEFERTDAGCLCHYEVSATARTALGHLILNTGFFPRAEKDFRRLCGQVGAWADGVQPVPYTVEPYRPGAVEMSRIEDMIRRLDESDYGHGLGRRLVDWVLAVQEVDLVRIRPYSLARELGVEKRQMVETMLQAVRTGLLQQRWDLLCPRCRGAKVSVDGLDQLPEEAHCTSCAIDYARDFDRNVELTFTPAEMLRPVYDGEYCLGGPMTTPHVMAQVRLEPNARTEWPGDLPPGPYRVRDLRGGPYAEIGHDGGAWPDVVLTEDAVRLGGRGEPGALGFDNRDRARRYAVIERRDWAADALTAAEVATLQAFRDLCAAQALRPGDSAGVSQVALMFTDLKNSTEMFERQGDGPAYALVREHFAWIAGIVRRHDGGIVKTMGDAVLAAFSDPRRALYAALAIQEEIAAFNSRNGSHLTIRIGLNAGPALAVTLNGRLDYFGHTPNLAARLEGQSQGGDIAFSEGMYADPTIQPIAQERDAVHETAPLRGIGAEISYWRIVWPKDPPNAF
ncbi:MAG: adenylate/guanylate cyclase domain-containing protein [Minwuia sp.]|uniref:adenylate/guanylate cyclase domain-containing protein n=1 Tax=Minwuia sp. TaxID=2493630 RepID=UPI003A8C0AE1